MLGLVLTLALQAAPLDFAEALERVEQTPAIQAARRAMSDRQALASSVSPLTSNPMLMLQPGARQLSHGSIQPEVYVSIAQDLNLAAYGSKRKRSALQEVKADSAALVLALHERRMQAAAAWLALWTAQGALSAASEELVLADEWSNRVARGAASGGLTKVDAAIAKTYRAEAHLAVLALEGEAFGLGVELNRVLALDSTMPATVALPLPDIAAPAADVIAPGGKAPALRLAEENKAADAARTREAEAMHGFGLQLGALVWREGGGDTAGVATLQLTLPIFERSQRERSVHAAILARADGEVQSARIEASAARVSAEHELEHTAATLAVVKDELVPAAQETMAGIERKFSLGDATAQELVVARRGFVGARSRLIRAQADVVLARFRAQELLSFANRSTP